MSSDSPATPASPLRDSLNLILRRKWTVLLVMVLVVGATMFFSYRQTPRYSATSRVLVRATSDDPNAYYTINLDTERGLAQSAAVAEVVKRDTGSPSTPDQLLSGLSVSVEPSTEILLMQYQASQAVQARDLANAFAEGYLEFRRGQALASYKVNAAEIQAEIDALNEDRQRLTAQLSKTNNVSRAQAINGALNVVNTRIAIKQEELSSLGSPETLSTSGGEVLQPAALPGATSSPDHVRNAMLGVVIGLALGLGIAFARDHFDERLQGSRDLERQLGAPVLATIPRVEDWRKRDSTELVALHAPRSATAEAYRALRTNLQFLARKDGVRLIAATSPYLGEGKTTTVANLAVTLAQAGKRVIAVSCDLRRPRLHRFFDLDNSVGVTNILLGEVTLPEAAQRPEGMSHLRILASGPVPPNPAELLGSDKLDFLLADLRSAADYVLLDTPPLLAVADSLILGPKADGVLIVVDASATRRGAAESVREQLEQVEAKIIGGIFNNFDPGRARYYYSGDYRTYYPYKYEEDDKRVAVAGEERPSWKPEDIWR